MAHVFFFFCFFFRINAQNRVIRNVGALSQLLLRLSVRTLAEQGAPPGALS